MTVSTTDSRRSYTGNGVTTNFSFPFYFLVNADLVVIKKLISTGAETILVLDTDYTVAGAGDAAGGSITTIGAGSPISALYKVTIYRDPEQTQETDLVENDNLPAEPVEKVFDRLTMITQRLANWISRTVKISDGTPDGVFDPTLPVDVALYPGTVPLLNDTATGFEMASEWPSAADIEDAEDWAVIAEGWAVRDTAQVEDAIGGAVVDNSAKSYAIGGTGAGQPAGGDAKSWAIKTTSFVTAGNFSAKEWATGIQNRGLANGGSAKDWSNYLAGTVDNSEYSSKKYANDSATSAAAGAVSAAASAASAAAAAAALASAFFRDVVYITSADSPFTVLQSHNGKLISVNSAGGVVTINLPSIAGLTLPFNATVFCATAGNNITVNRNGADTIGGATSQTLSVAGTGLEFVADTDAAPDDWTALPFGTIADGAVSLAKLSTAAQQTLAPPGVMLPYGGLVAPSGWLLCDGRRVSRSTYATLFGVISTYFGSGDGATTFNLPDKRGKFVRGYVGITDKAFTADASSEQLTVAGHEYNRSVVPVRVSNSGGGLPAGLAVDTTYYTIYVDDNTLQLATTEANALTATPINITTAGTGTHTIVQWLDPDRGSRTAPAPGGASTLSPGAVQPDALQGHEHTVPMTQPAIFGGGGGSAYRDTGGTTDTNGIIANATNGTPRTSFETRPNNSAENWIIKT